MRSRAQIVATIAATGQSGFHLGPGEARIASTFDPVTSSLAGTVETGGTIASTFDDVSSSLVGAVDIGGTIASTFDGVTSSLSGTVSDAPSATFTLSPESWHTRTVGAWQAQYGGTKWGNYLALPSNAAATDYYVWETHDDGTGRYVGVDPGDFVAGLSGWTGIEVQHPAGNRTASQRATAVAAAINGGTPHAAVVVGVTVEVSGAIDTCSVGGMWNATKGLIGCRRQTPTFDTFTISTGVGSPGVSPSGRTVIVKSIRVYVGITGDDMRAAIYTGGSTTRGDYAATTMRAEVVVPTGATGWVTIPLLPSQIFSMTSATSYRLVLKGDSGIAAPGYMDSGLTGTDMVDVLEVYTTGIDPDPSVAWPSSLSGVTNTGVFQSPVMMAIEYVDAGGTTAEWVTRWGCQVADPTTLLQQSSLIVPDAGGADLMMGQDPPNVLGLLLRSEGIGFGEDHSTQLREFVAQGGSVGDAVGADVLWQAQSTGSTTQAWVELAANDAPIDPTEVLWWGARNNNAGVTFRFAFFADFDDASPDDNPSDFEPASEYEIFRSVNGDGTGGNVHDTNPANAVVSPIATDGGFVATNTNHPAAYLLLYVPADTVA